MGSEWNVFKNDHFYDDCQYDLKDITFDDQKNGYLYDGGVIEYSKLSKTGKLCIDEYLNKGKLVCPVCGVEAGYVRRVRTHAVESNSYFHWSFFGNKIENDGTCEYREFSKDHVIPKSLNRSCEVQYVPMCRTCNGAKSNKVDWLSPEEIGFLAKQIKAERWIAEYALYRPTRNVRENLDQKNHEDRCIIESINKIRKYIQNHIDEYSKIIISDEINIKEPIQKFRKKSSYSRAESVFFDNFIGKKYDLSEVKSANRHVIDEVLQKFRHLIFNKMDDIFLALN